MGKNKKNSNDQDEFLDSKPGKNFSGNIKQGFEKTKGLATEIGRTTSQQLNEINKLFVKNRDALIQNFEKSKELTEEVNKQSSKNLKEIERLYEEAKSKLKHIEDLYDESKVKEVLDLTRNKTGEHIDIISGKKFFSLVKERMEKQDRYNDILATKLFEALARIDVLEQELNKIRH